MNWFKKKQKFKIFDSSFGAVKFKSNVSHNKSSINDKKVKTILFELQNRVNNIPNKILNKYSVKYISITFLIAFAF